MAPHASSPIPWHQRLEARVAGSISLVVALALGTAVFGTTRAVTTRALDRAATDLESARVAFDHLVDDRAEFAASQAALVTALPIFREHLTDRQLAGDRASLEVMGDNYRQMMKADFAIVADRTARWIATPGWPQDTGEATAPAALRAAIVGATAGRSPRAMVEAGGRLFLVVSEPARFAEEVLGTLTVGFALDDALATRLAAETHGDVSLVAGRHLSASSLTGADRDGLAALVGADSPRLRGDSPRTVQQVGGGQYTLAVFPLSAAGPTQAPGAARIILLQNWAPTQAFINDTSRRLLEAGLAIFLPALGVGLVFSRRMSRPLKELVAASGDIAGGNWQRKIEPSGGAETRMMARAFNDMTASLVHWYEEASKRDDELRQAQKMEAIGRLAGGVAHDFNNLLTAIKGYGEIVLDTLPPDDPHRDDVMEIVRAADRAADLTRQLLTFSRRSVVTTRVLELTTVVAGTEQLLRRLIGEDITLTSAFAPNAWHVHGDVGQLEQVVVNLAVNARDAMPDGGSLRIELSNVVFGDGTGVHHPRLPQGQYVQLAISDTGTGMSEETAARIFEPFFTTKEAGRGTGLGLAMVYGVVDQSGGAIDVDTAVGRGTTFRVYLPRATESAAAHDEGQLAAMPEALGGSETILLVEDDQNVSALVSRALTKAGYEVLVAADGPHALDAMRAFERPIDLLLTDVVMPGMNGRELAEQVVAARPGTRVLFMSGYSDDAILRHGVQTATAHFIQKPFSMDALALKIREALTTALLSS